MRIRDGDSSDPGWKKVGSGINIPDPQPYAIVDFIPPIRDYEFGYILYNVQYA
jgi:hypothetical protein